MRGSRAHGRCSSRSTEEDVGVCRQRADGDEQDWAKHGTGLQKCPWQGKAAGTHDRFQQMHRG